MTPGYDTPDFNNEIPDERSLTLMSASSAFFSNSTGK